RTRRAAEPPAQRDRERERVAGRGRVPARSDRGRCRSLLRHSGGEARRSAGGRDPARQSRPVHLGKRKPRNPQKLRRTPPVGAPPGAPASKAKDGALGKLVAAPNPDEMSPREAMDALYALKAKLTKS